MLKRILLFVAVLELVFVVHEYGHYTELVKRDIPVEEFSLGIGPAIYQHKTDGLTISFRAVPIMAYVAPTKEGRKIETQSSFVDKFIISSAGVRNNLLSGVGFVALLNVISWRRGIIDGHQLIGRAFSYPFKALYVFVFFFLDSLTLRKFSLGKNCKLHTGSVHPPEIVEMFIFFSFLIGYANFLPLYPMDGGKICVDALSYFLNGTFLNIVRILSQTAFFFFCVFGVSTIEFVDYDE